MNTAAKAKFDANISKITIVNEITPSKLIPQNILLVLEFEGLSKLAIYYTKLLQTDWKPTENCTIELWGLNLDKVWENIVVDISGVNITDGNTLEEQIAANERHQKIKKDCQARKTGT